VKVEPPRVLTFDCYGTLIDWEAGILMAMRPILEEHGKCPPDEEVLGLFGTLEARIESSGYRPYREVLAGVVDGFGETLGFEPSAGERTALAESVENWPPFADTVVALRAFGGKYRLAVISNIDDDLFQASSARLGVEFDEVVTAEQVGCYKPSLKNFQVAFERLGHGPDGILHVAQSLYHDIAPARALGLRNVWVNRRAEKKGPGATSGATAKPDLEVPDLMALSSLMGLDSP
jgi:2-haloacid dehalogenase